MRINYLLLLTLLLFALIACKQEVPATEEQPASETTTADANNASSAAPLAKNPNLVANMSWTFLTDQLFHHRVTVTSGKVDENLRKGHWMDFHDNGSYDYGVWGEKTYDGSWTYDDATKLLQLKPNGAKDKMSEWRVMHKDNNLILIGTTTYSDNPQQVQWIRHENRPDKNAKPKEDEDE